MSVLFSVYAPGANSASNYVSICKDAVGDTLFLYEHLIRNKIVPERWFSFDELSISFSSSSGSYMLYRRKPKREVMCLRAIRGYAGKLKAKKVKSEFPGLRFEPINTPVWIGEGPVQEQPYPADPLRPAARPYPVDIDYEADPAPPAPIEMTQAYRDRIRELQQAVERLQRPVIAQQQAPIAIDPLPARRVFRRG